MKHALKYGENPQQAAHVEFDRDAKDPLALGYFKTADGKSIRSSLNDIGWVNLTDLDRGIDALARVAGAFEVNTGSVPKIAIVLQHGNASGAAFGHDDQVINHAIHCNYRASYGAMLVTNVEITNDVALHLRHWMPAKRPFSGIAAPAIEPVGASFFTRKKGTCHLMVNKALASIGVRDLKAASAMRSIRGATLHQEPNTYVPKLPKKWSTELIADMCLAWGIAMASDSNAVAIAKNGRLVANAAGGQNRAAVCESAVLQAKRNGTAGNLKGAAVASDGYFAFADGIDGLARKKVKAIFATNGSINDKEVAEHAASFKDLIFYTVSTKVGRGFAGH